MSAFAGGNKRRIPLSAYFEPRARVMLALGFASGLPFYLVGNTFALWLRTGGISLSTIGFLSWVGLAYSLQVFWAPLLDRVPLLKALGQRRGWLAASQVCVAAGLFAMAYVGLDHGLTLLGALALFVAFASATQDIALAAWRIESARDADELGLLTAANTMGYQIAVILTASVLLSAAQHLSWQTSYAICAASMAIGLIATFLAEEPVSGDCAIAERTPLWGSHPFSHSFAARLDIVNGPNRALQRSLWAVAVIAVLWVCLHAHGAAHAFTGAFMARMSPWAAAGATAAWLVIAAGLSLPLWMPSGDMRKDWLLRVLWLLALVGTFWLWGPAGAFAANLAGAFRLVLPISLATAFGQGIAWSLVALCITMPVWLPAGVADAVANPFVTFFKSHGRFALLMLAAISLYRVPDFVRGPMITPFYHDVGMSNDVIAAVRLFIGLPATFLGMAAGGFLSLRIGPMRALVVGGFCQAAGIAIHALLALEPGRLALFLLVMGVDDFSIGLAGIMLVTYMSSLTNLGYTATQYALMSSTYALVGKTLKGFSGSVVDSLTGAFGLMHAYAAFFLGTGFIGIPATLLFLWLAALQRPKPAVPSVN